MVFNLLIFACMGALLFLGIWEFRRYGAARDDTTALAYPRSRLIRRELTALLGVAILSGLTFKPAGLSNGQDLLWYGGCMILTLVVIFFAVQDLREASQAALEARREFQMRAADHLEGLLKESRRSTTHPPKGEKPRPGG